jgi:hypothetical protein
MNGIWSWEEIFLTGEKQLSTELAKALNIDNLNIISKNINGTAPHKVLQEVYQNV